MNDYIEEPNPFPLDISSFEAVTLWLWEQMKELADKQPLLIGTGLLALGHAAHKAYPYAKDGMLSPGHRIQAVGAGIIAIESGEDNILSFLSTLTGSGMILAGISGIDPTEGILPDITIEEGTWGDKVLDFFFGRPPITKYPLEPTFPDI